MDPPGVTDPAERAIPAANPLGQSGSTSGPCRLIHDLPGDGPWNMAVDEALLEDAARSGRPTLRFYGWAEPTLSLGYFQPYAQRASHPPSSRCAVVRRPTGGGAILHDAELTY